MEEGKKMSEENPNLIPGDEIQSDGDDDDDFEFAVGFGSPPESDPVYPVFNRSLLSDPDPKAPLLVPDLRSGSASSSSSAEESCTWSPSSPNRCKKSSSTGSAPGSSRRFKLRDLVSGRSHSDGKEKFVNIEPEKLRVPKANPNPNPNPNSKGGDGKKNLKPGEMDLLTAHRLFYGKDGEKGVKGGRPYLPPRSGPVGLFANGNGLSRTKFPF